MSLGKGSQTTVNKTELDPASQAYLDAYRRQASQAAQGVMNGRPITPGSNRWLDQSGRALQNMGGLNPQMLEALQGYQGLAGNLGFGSQTGLGGIDAYMNPYIGNVVNAANAAYDRSGQLGMNAASDLATRSGAFGGSRSAVLQAEALGQNELARNQGISGLYQSGFQDAAGQLQADRMRAANLGLAGLGGISGIGQYGDAQRWAQQQGLLQFGDLQRQIQQQQMMDPVLRQQIGLGFLGGGLGQGGMTQTQTTQSNPGLFQSLLGAGLTAGGLGAFGWAPGALFGLTGMGGNL